MSRIGRRPITIPAKVEVAIDGTKVVVKCSQRGTFPSATRQCHHLPRRTNATGNSSG